MDGTRTAGVQDHVHRYLEFHEVEAEYILNERGAMDQLNQTVTEREVDIVLMGTHGGSLFQQVFTGSALDHMLRESKVPTFICR
jgi:nucleotide-binding universal stress UspA family protein